MFISVRVAIIALLLSVLFVATGAMADCSKYDVVGNTQLAPSIVLSPDGQVTFGMANWWEDDVYACYNTFLTPAYLAYFGGCDLDGSGLVEIGEVLEIYNFVLNHPTGGVPAYAYQCPSYACPADMPAFYDVASDQLDWIASGVCTEFNGISGPPACPEAQHLGIVADLNYIIANYPFTGAVLDGHGGQAFATVPYSLICALPIGQVMTAATFADINACYHGNDNMLFSGNMNIVEFDWAVNAGLALAEYQAVIQAEFGPEAFCEADLLIMGDPTGFHATLSPIGLTRYTVTVKDECDLDGCKCDAELSILSDGAGGYIPESLVNLSQGCSDPNFNF